jgi:hypothetical protein
MFKFKILILIAFFSKNLSTFGKIIPADNSVLHYNRIYFEEEFMDGASHYELIYFDSIPGSQRGETIHLSGKLPAFETRDLKWNTTFYWYLKAYGKSKNILSRGNLHRFELLKVESQNKEFTRLVIKTNKSEKHAGGYICLDYSRSIYDREGKVVWTIPVAEDMHPERNQIRDMKITSENTITFLNGNFPLEIDLEGNILWAAPYPYVINADTVFYHHDFKKTTRGTYMVMGNKRAYRKVIGSYPIEKLNREFEVKLVDGQIYCKVLMNCILEFNKEGKLIWLWDANDYITDEDLNFKKGPMKIPGFATHANAFSENEAGTKVYVGFRDLSRIVRIDKKSEKVEQSYGEKYPSGDAQLGADLFRRQHDASVTKRQTILLLNNNSPPGGGGGVSSVMEIKENGLVSDSLVVWKLNLNFDTLTDGKSISGGDVVELPNSNLLVCAGLLNRLFEVSRKKEIVWDAFVQAKRDEETEWRNSPQYRCNWVKELKWIHFLCREQSFKKKGKELEYTLNIYNTGSHPDHYIVDLVNENSTSLLKTETKPVKPGSNLKHTLTINEKDLQSKELLVIIKSKQASDFKILKISK